MHGRRYKLSRETHVNITAVPGTLIQNSIAEDDETNRSRRLALLRTALSSCPIVAKD